MNLIDAAKLFATPEACVDYLEAVRWLASRWQARRITGRKWNWTVSHFRSGAEYAILP